jgi:hypothetical protein
MQLVNPSASRAGRIVNANTKNVSPMLSSWATSAKATVAPLTADRNRLLRPFASKMVDAREDWSVVLGGQGRHESTAGRGGFAVRGSAVA